MITKTVRTAVLVALALQTQLGPTTAQSLDVAALEEQLERTVREKHIPGLSVGVMHEGGVVLTKAYGVRSLATREPLATDHLLAIGSVTKQFTCAAALLLAEDGKLSIDDPVSKYFPDLTRASEISLLDLGQHVSGYRDYYPLDFVHHEMSQPRESDDIIREFASRPLDFDPGSRWSYSNTGYLMLGRVVERLSDEPFGEFLSRRILEPLGMRHTRYEPAREEKGLAQGYTAFALATPEPAIAEGDGWIAAAGGMWSTPRDLLAWDLAFMDGKVLAAESRAAMTTPRPLSDGSSSGYGCGLFVRDVGSSTVLSHTGGLSGFVASNTFIPSTRSAVAVIASVDFAAIREMVDAVVARLLPAPASPLAVDGPPAKDVALDLLNQFRDGRVDRAMLAEDFSRYLTEERLTAAAESLRALGDASEIVLVGLRERGEMEVATLHFTLGTTPVQALLYRTRDGKVEEFLFNRR